MMIKRTLIICLVLLAYQAKATHLVGGEFQLQHLEGTRYILYLHQYFDHFNGNPGAFDPTILVTLYSAETSIQDTTFLLPLTERQFLEPPFSLCDISFISIEKLTYSAEIDLAHLVKPGDYYFMHERCCRNGLGSNIVVDIQTSFVFVLDFKGPFLENDTLANSSPVFITPLQEFACIGTSYEQQVTLEDQEGDSLVYQLVNPLGEFSEFAIPLPRPRPYPPVPWAPGISLESVIPGDPPLSLSENGLLQVTPNSAGLFQYAVQVEEYREGLKIATARREFQLLVMDCIEDTPAELSIYDKGGNLITEQDTLLIANEELVCIDLEISDEAGDQVVVEVEHSDQNLFPGFLFVRDTIVFPNEKLQVEFCLPQCSVEEYHSINIRVSDDLCREMKVVERELVLKYGQPTGNTSPNSTTSLAFDSTASTYILPIFQDLQAAFRIDFNDVEGDSIKVETTTIGFDPDTINMVLPTILLDSAGSYLFEWIPPDTVFNNPEDSTQFQLILSVTDFNTECGTKSRRELPVLLLVQPPNDSISIETGLNFRASQGVYNQEVVAGNELIVEFSIGAENVADLSVSITANNFSLDSLIYTVGSTINGNDLIYNFNWQTTISNLGGSDSMVYELHLEIHESGTQVPKQIIPVHLVLLTDVVTGISTQEFVLTPYPNPTSGVVNLQNIWKDNPILSVVVLDITGKILLKYQFLKPHAVDKIPITLPNLPGVYLLRVESDKGYRQFRVVRQ